MASNFHDLKSTHRVSLVLPNTDAEEPNVVVRRLSTPFHGLPRVIDYDPETGYITFGETIPPPPKVVHPRRYREPGMPLLNTKPGTCRHYYCWTNRRRLYGLNVDVKPVGLPWASGLLKNLPGHVKYTYPIPKVYKPEPRRKKRKPSMRGAGEDRWKLMSGVLEEVLDFYKVLMLAGWLIKEARVELGLTEEGEGGAQPPADEGEAEAGQLGEDSSQTTSAKSGSETAFKPEAGGDVGENAQEVSQQENLGTQEGGGEDAKEVSDVSMSSQIKKNDNIPEEESTEDTT